MRREREGRVAHPSAVDAWLGRRRPVARRRRGQHAGAHALVVHPVRHGAHLRRDIQQAGTGARAARRRGAPLEGTGRLGSRWWQGCARAGAGLAGGQAVRGGSRLPAIGGVREGASSGGGGWGRGRGVAADSCLPVTACWRSGERASGGQWRAHHVWEERGGAVDELGELVHLDQVAAVQQLLHKQASGQQPHTLVGEGAPHARQTPCSSRPQRPQAAILRCAPRQGRPRAAVRAARLRRRSPAPRAAPTGQASFAPCAAPVCSPAPRAAPTAPRAARA